MGGRGSGNGESGKANLTHKKGVHFQRGQSGNPTGRAHRTDTLITIALREKLASVDPETKQTFAQRIAELLLKCVIDPDPELDKTRIMAICEITDRVEGKPKQQLELNDITAQLRERSTEDLMFHLEHGYWPEDEYQHKRNQRILEATNRLEAAKTDTDTTQ